MLQRQGLDAASLAAMAAARLSQAPAARAA
jgi:hypothetical protein